MIQIRQNVFETNSSSVHTMTITDKDTYSKWLNNELLYINEDECWVVKKTKYENEDFITKEEAIDLYNNIKDDPYLPEFKDVFQTYYDFIDYHEDLYVYEENYTTKSGDEIVAFGVHGYCG